MLTQYLHMLPLPGKTVLRLKQDADSGPCLSIKTIFPRYGDSHVKDKAVARPSYLQHGNPCTGKTASWYWDGPLVPCMCKTSLEIFYVLIIFLHILRVWWLHHVNTWPLTGKLMTQFTSNSVYIPSEWVYGYDWILGSIGPIAPL